MCVAPAQVRIGSQGILNRVLCSLAFLLNLKLSTECLVGLWAALLLFSIIILHPNDLELSHLPTWEQYTSLSQYAFVGIGLP